MPELFKIMSDQLQGYQKQLQTVWDTDLEAVNKELTRLKLLPLDPKCDKPEGCLIM
jgi:hypothetical protein